MPLDAHAYLHLLDDLAMPEAAKIEMMEQVSRILESFVDRAFGRSSEQILLGTKRMPISACGRDALELGSTLNPTFNDAASGDAAGKRRP